MKVGELPDEGLSRDLDAWESGREQRAASVIAHADTAPDQHAEVLRLSRVLGLPAPAVAVDPKQFKVDEDRQRLEQLALDSPTVAAWAQEPDNYAVAKDELEHLGLIERLWRHAFPALGSSTVASYAGAQGALADLADPLGITDPKGIVGRVLPKPLQQALADQTGAGRLRFAAGESQAASREMGAEAMRGVEQPRSYSDLLRHPVKYAPYMAVMTAQSAPPMAAAMALRRPQLAEGVMGVTTGLSTYADTRVEGGSSTQAAAAALGSGVLEGKLGSLTFEAAMRPSVSAMRRVITAGATEAWTEGLTGGGQYAVQQGVLGRPIEPEDLLRQTVEGAVLGSALGGGVGGFEEGMQRVLGERMAPIDDALKGAGFLKTLQGLASEARLATRNPHGLADLVARLRDSGGPSHAFIPAEDFVTLFQSEADAQRAAAAYAGPDALEVALAAGGDLAIPMPMAVRLLASDVGQQAVGKMRLDSAHLQADEAIAVDRQAEVEKVLAELNAAFGKATASTAGEAAAEQDILGELVATGRYSPGDAQAMAQLLPRFYAGLARAKGVDVDTVRAQYPVAVISATIGDRLRRADPRGNSTAITPILDAIRTGKVPTMREAYGPSLVDALVAGGGIADSRGELRSLDAHRARVGLMNNSGRSLDEALTYARELGFFPPADPDAPDELAISDLLDAIEQDLRGNGVYRSTPINPALAQLKDDVRAWEQELPALLGAGETLTDLLALPDAEIMRRARRAVAEAYQADGGDTTQLERGATESLFPDSKVVDSTGKLLTMWHGGSFPGVAGAAFALPSFFTADRAAAESYLNNPFEPASAVLTPVHLDIRNPASEDDIRGAAIELLREEPGALPYSEQEILDGIVPAFELITPGQQDAAEQIIAALLAHGFDGARLPNDFYLDAHRMMESWAVFEPGRIASAEMPGVYFQEGAGAIAPPFTSALRNLVDEAKGAPKKASGEAWIQWLDGAQRRGAIRAAERDWMGLDDWLRAEPEVARAQLQDFVRANTLHIEERALGEPSPIDLDALPYKTRVVDGVAVEIVGPTGIVANRWHADDVGLEAAADTAEAEAYDLSIAHLRSQGGTLTTVPVGFVVERISPANLEASGMDENDAEVGRWGLFAIDDNGETEDFMGQASPGFSYARAVAELADMAAEQGGMGDGAAAGFITTSAPYANMVLPGGVPGSYRVLHFILPPQAPAAERQRLASMEEALAERVALREQRTAAWAREEDMAVAAAMEQQGNIDVRDIRALESDISVLRQRLRTDYLFTGGHWSGYQHNVMMHARFDERLDADGRRVLMIQELQSDWHQAAHRTRSAIVGKLVEQGATKAEAEAAVPKGVGYKGGGNYTPEEVAGFTVDEVPLRYQLRETSTNDKRLVRSGRTYQDLVDYALGYAGDNWALDYEVVSIPEVNHFTIRDAVGAVVTTLPRLSDATPASALEHAQMLAREGSLNRQFRADTSAWTATPARSPGFWTVLTSDGRFVAEQRAASAAEAIAMSAPTASFTKTMQVPDAPLKTTWLEVASKRLIRWAAENGYHAVSWPRVDQVPLVEQWPMTSAQIRADTEGEHSASRRFGAILDRYEFDVPRAMKAIGKPHGAPIVDLDLSGTKKPATDRDRLHAILRDHMQRGGFMSERSIAATLESIDNEAEVGDLSLPQAVDQYLFMLEDTQDDEDAEDNADLRRRLEAGVAEFNGTPAPAGAPAPAPTPAPTFTAMDDIAREAFAGAEDFENGDKPLITEFNIPGTEASAQMVADASGVTFTAVSLEDMDFEQVDGYLDWETIADFVNGHANGAEEDDFAWTEPVGEGSAQALLAAAWSQPGFAGLFPADVTELLEAYARAAAPAGWGAVEGGAEVGGDAQRLGDPVAMPAYLREQGFGVNEEGEPWEWRSGTALGARTLPGAILWNGARVEGHFILDPETVSFASNNAMVGEGSLHLWRSWRSLVQHGEITGDWTSGVPTSPNDAVRAFARLYDGGDAGFWRGWDASDTTRSLGYAPPVTPAAPPNQALEITDKLRAAALGGFALFQEGRGKERGSIQFPRIFGEGGESLIRVAEGADRSTFLHELGHFYLEVLAAEAMQPGAPATLQADFDRILKWFGVADRGAWQMMGVEAKRPFHEQFARGFELYLAEGKAPAPGLRGAFRKFKAWMLEVYQDLTKLNVQLTPEVRDVFDRLLATDEELAAARELQGLEPVLPKGAELGLSPAVLREYAAALEKARESLGSRVAGAKLREARADYRAAVKAEVERLRPEAEAMPVYAALRRLRAPVGQGGALRLSRPQLAALFGDGFLARLRGLTADDGVPMDLAADALGFPTGRELVDALINAPPLEQFLAAEADARVRERMGDPMTDGTVTAAAVDALHNSRMARALDAEIAALAELAGEPRPKPGVLGEAARRHVAGLTGRDVQPHRYLAAERKAAGEAAKAAAAGKYAEALAAKRQQALNAALYSAARAAQVDLAKLERRARRLGTKAAKERLAAAGADEYFHRVEDLLRAYEFRTVSRRAVERRASLRSWVDARQAAGDVTGISDELLARVESERVINWKDARVSELRALDEALANIEHLAGLKNKLLAARRQATKDQAVAEMIAHGDALELADRPVVVSGADLTSRQALLEKVRSWVDGLTRPEFIIEALDGGETGPFHDFLWRAQVDAENVKLGLQRRVGAGLKAVMAKMPAGFMDSLNERVAFKGMPTSRYTLVSAAFNLGNAGNLQRLRDRGWSNSAGDSLQLTDADLGELANMLTAAEWRFVQGVWDVLESLRPDIEALTKEMGGIPVTFVEATRLSVRTSDGVELQLRGGYWPLVYDSDRSNIGERQEGDDALKILMQAGASRAATSKGYTKERAEVVSAPLRLDFGQVLARSLDQVMTDLAYRKPVRDLMMLLKDQRLKTWLIAKIGRTGYDALNGGVAYSVSAGADVAGLVSKGDRAILDWTMANMAVSALAIRPDVALGNYGSALVQGMNRVQGRWLMRGLRRLYLDRGDLTAEIVAMSPMMRNRLEEIDHGYQELLRKTRNPEGRKGAFKIAYYRVMMTLHRQADREVARAVWWGRYEQARADGHAPPEAIELADAAVRTTQTTQGKKDKSISERDPALAQSRMFMGPMYVQFGQLLAAARGTGTTRTVGARVVSLLLTWGLAPALFVLLAGRVPEDKDDDGVGTNDWARWLAINVGLYPLQTMPLVRDLAGVAESAITGKPVSPRASPLAQAVGTLQKGIAGLWKEVADEEGDGIEFWDATNDLAAIASPFVAVPASQLRKSLRGVDYLLDNPDTGYLGMTEALIYGKPITPVPED